MKMLPCRASGERHWWVWKAPLHQMCSYVISVDLGMAASLTRLWTRSLGSRCVGKVSLWLVKNWMYLDLCYVILLKTTQRLEGFLPPLETKCLPSWLASIYSLSIMSQYRVSSRLNSGLGGNNEERIKRLCVIDTPLGRHTLSHHWLSDNENVAQEWNVLFLKLVP